MVDNEKLKRCPFCGGKASYNNDSYSEWIECDDCGARGAERGWGSKSRPVEQSWNERVDNAK